MKKNSERGSTCYNWVLNCVGGEVYPELKRGRTAPKYLEYVKTSPRVEASNASFPQSPHGRFWLAHGIRKSCRIDQRTFGSRILFSKPGFK